MKLFNNAFTPFLVTPKGHHKHFDINPGTIVEAIDLHPVTDDEKHTYVMYRQTFGWVRNEVLEPYTESLPKNCVRIGTQTPDPNDFEQYLLWDGIKQVNACGEICAAHILGLDLDTTVQNWQLKAPSVWKRIRGKGKWSGTGPDDLISLFGVFGQEAVSLSTVLKRYTMKGLQELLDAGDVIVSCKIDGGTGRLRGQGILHWVTVDALYPERQYGFVDVMNPAPNRIERYSFDEFLKSCVVPYGVFVPNSEVPKS